MKLILFAYYIMIFDEINFHNFAANDLNYSNCVLAVRVTCITQPL